MSSNRQSPPRFISAQKKIRVLWRCVLALFALGGLFLEYVSYNVTRSINGYYFKDFSPPAFGVSDIVVIVLAAYLLLVSITGRWSLFRGVS